MPANLPPEYFEAEKKLRLAKTPEEKIAVLQEMLAIMPKHKGTEKLQGELKAKISKLRKEAQKRRVKRKGYGFHIPKEGAAQVVLAGPPNGGKSQIVAQLTKANPEVAPYPFTTRKPVVGMTLFEDVYLQLVDLPPITEEFTEPWVMDLVRRADLVLLVIDLGQDDVLDQVETVVNRLERSKIRLAFGPMEEEDGYSYKKVLLVSNKIDLPRAEERLEILRDLYGQGGSVVPISAREGVGLEELKREIFLALDIIRVYTKAPGKPVDRSEPVILPRGSTVIDAALSIHKDFAEKLKYARLWSPDNRFNGQRVERAYVLEDGDVVEFKI